MSMICTTQGRLGRGLCLLAAMSMVVPAGCGSANELILPPQVEYTVNGAPNRKVVEFAPDTTGGQLTMSAKILILNSGSGTAGSSGKPSPLRLKDIKFTTTNPFLKLIYPKGKPSFPIALAENERIQLEVRFAPDPSIENNESAILTIEHNDANKETIKIQFKIRLSGPRINLEDKNYVFLNPSSANPPTACFKFGNRGSAPLIFKSAQMGSATKVYDIISTPNDGDTIDPLGQGNNPKANPKKLKVCVRLSPGDKGDDYDAKLVIVTNDPAEREAKVTMSAKWELDNVFKVTCGTPDGSLKYDFSGVTSGIIKKCCNIYNEGPSGMLINTVNVTALQASNQDTADAVFGRKIYKLDPKTLEQQQVKLPRSISKGKSLEFCVEYIYPNDNKTTNAELVVSYSQANIAGFLRLPVLAGSCATPDPQLAPSSTSLWMQTLLGSKATKTLTLVNQSCAPLQILQVCTTQVASVPGGGNPCDNATLASAHFKLTKEIGLMSVKAWDVLPIDVTFEPPSEKYKSINHFLNVVYCPGSWANDKCSDTVVTRTVNLSGVVDSDPKKLVALPTLKLAAFNEQKPTLSQPFKIEAAAKKGNDWPIGKYGAYLWTLTKRPAGSTLWISNDFQLTDVPYLTVVPDRKGSYTITGQVQAVDEADQSSFVWSDQVKFSFDVAE